MSHSHIVRHRSRKDWRINAIAIRKTTLTGKVIRVSFPQSNLNRWTALLGVLTISVGTTKWFEKNELKYPEGWEDQKD